MKNNQRSILPPWASGPSEILQHGLDLLKNDSDANRRLAMISIDNAVELIIKTYLGLPKRVNGLKIVRAEYQEFSESFQKLLDALEKYDKERLGSLDLGEIEWYHRLRNQLYHQGNGLTVERAKVEIYGQLAVSLFENLFDAKLLPSSDNSQYVLVEFIRAWAAFERAASDLSSSYYWDENLNRRNTTSYANELYHNGYLTKPELLEVNNMRSIRNQVVHDDGFLTDVLKADMVERMKQITHLVQERINGEM